MLLVIDGYNVLRAVFFSQEGMLTKERAAFIADLGTYRDIRGHDIIIVFDAGPALHATREVVNGVVVMYSGQKSTADEWIIDFMKREREKEKLLVSRDRSLIDQCKQYTVEDVDPEWFYWLVQETITYKRSRQFVKDNAPGGLAKYEHEEAWPVAIDTEELDRAMLEATANGIPDTDAPEEKRQKSDRVSKKEKKRAKLLKKL